MKTLGKLPLLFLCVLLNSCEKEASSKGPVTVALGKEAPDFEFTDLATDKREKLSDFKGKVVVAKFWWSKCAICNDKMDHMQTFIEEHQEWKDKVVYLAVSIDPTIEAAKRHIAAVEKEENRSWSKTLNTWHDAEGGQSLIYKAYAEKTGVPVSYVIDRSGKVTAIDSIKDPEELDLDKAVRKVLEQ
jgi:peroxiredoxin